MKSEKQNCNHSQTENVNYEGEIWTKCIYCEDMWKGDDYIKKDVGSEPEAEGDMLFKNVPEEVREDINQLKCLMQASGLNELRIMMCLDIWVKEWKLEIKGHCNNTDTKNN